MRSACVGGLSWIAVSGIAVAQHFPDMDYDDYEVVGSVGEKLIVESNGRQFLCRVKDEWAYVRPQGCSPFSLSSEIAAFDRATADAARIAEEAEAAKVQAAAEAHARAQAEGDAKAQAELDFAKSMAQLTAEEVDQALGELSQITEAQFTDVVVEALRANNCELFVSGVSFMAPETLDVVGRGLGLSDPLTDAQRNAVRVRLIKSTNSLLMTKAISFSTDMSVLKLRECP